MRVGECTKKRQIHVEQSTPSARYLLPLLRNQQSERSPPSRCLYDVVPNDLP